MCKALLPKPEQPQNTRYLYFGDDYRTLTVCERLKSCPESPLAFGWPPTGPQSDCVPLSLRLGLGATLMKNHPHETN